MPRARKRLPESMKDLLRDDWQTIIDRSMLGREDRLIAERYLLDGVPQIDIAEELAELYHKSYSRSSITMRMPIILRELERVALKIDQT